MVIKYMKLRDIKEKLKLEAVYEKEDILDLEVTTACGADLMSDVLAFSDAKTMLITGLTNPQVIRTSEMIGIQVIIFVRGKSPVADTVKLAQENDISLYKTKKPMFETCGILYKLGVEPEKMVQIE